MVKVRGRKSWVGFLNRLKLHDIIEVEAKDHTSISPWNDIDEIKNAQPLTIYQMGYYVNHDKDTIRIASNLCDGAYALTSIIPISPVTSIRKLK